MPLTVIVRSATGDETRLTFDGTQRVAIGRGPGCDVRLPHPTVSHRHAYLRAQGAEFVLIDEGSTNGTVVGGVPIAAGTSRIVRSGDLVRVGGVWIEIRIDQSAVTRDVASATREMALAFVSQILAAQGADTTPKVRVVEGRDQGSFLALAVEGRAYVVGRAAQCDLPLADPDASREHVRIVRNGTVVRVEDLGAKNGIWLGESRPLAGSDSLWRPTQMMRVGRSVLALLEPVGDALAALEAAPDEELAPDAILALSAPLAAVANVAPSSPTAVGPAAESAAAPMAPVPVGGRARSKRTRGLWSATDMVVMIAALGVLVLSIAGLVWLLRG
jgi:pSer/pThr/pTyr-binding forkhead associated (FHA) protein